MPYAPTVNDNSGQILAGYQTRSAEITAAGNEALTKGIVSGVTSAIGGIAGAYTQSRMQAAGGKAFKEFMGVAGPSMGLKDEQLKMFKGMNDQDAFQMSQMFMPVAPSMVSANTWAPRAAMQSQNAVYQNQVPANQQPVSAGGGGGGAAPAASPMGGVNFNFVN
jgi:hypothetical protein